MCQAGEEAVLSLDTVKAFGESVTEITIVLEEN
jgi:hypothetical protein